MCDFGSNQQSFQKVLAEFGKLDILINTAGRSQRARWEHTDIQVDQDLFNLNVFSVVSLTRTVLPHMLENKSGTVAVMSSSAGKAGSPFSGTYTGSKHAVHGYFESLRSEKVWTGLEVCMLCPGPTFSNLLAVVSTEKLGEKFGESMNATAVSTFLPCQKLGSKIPGKS
jgi:dehydrogenase/reductase SDR family protein 7